MLAPQKESIFGCSCRLWLLSWRRVRVFARSCSLLSKYLPISWKQRKEQSHAQCHVTHRIRIFDKISEHVKVAKSVDIAIPELAVTFNKPVTVCQKYFKVFYSQYKQAWNGPSRRHIKGSKLAKGLQNFQVSVNWDYFYEVKIFEKKSHSAEKMDPLVTSGIVCYAGNLFGSVPFDRYILASSDNFVELLVELFWSVKVVLKTPGDEKP